MKIIGIGGLSRSGKDTLAEWLVEKGYFGVSLGDIVRNESKKRHANQPDPISVTNMTQTSNWLRQTKGSDFALKEAISRFNEAGKTQNYQGLVLYSVRAPVEVDYIKQNGGKVVWVKANPEIRYQRAKKSRREGEAEISQAQFDAQENLQWQPQPGIPPKAQMSAKYVKENADIFLQNNGSLEEFQATAKKALDL